MINLETIRAFAPLSNYLEICLWVCLFVFFITFLYVKHKQLIMKDYNRFVDVYYKKQGIETPTLILRIQNGNIRRYNNCCKMFLCKFMFFKPMAEVSTKIQGYPVDDREDYVKVNRRMIPQIATRSIYNAKKDWDQY